MSGLFEKVMVITDAHFGRAGNSAVANQDNLDFLEWAIDRGRCWGATICIFMGDWFDNRYSIGVFTLNSALLGLEMLNTAFEKVYFLSGNHDLPFRDKRDSASIEIARNLCNIEIIRNPTTINNVTFLPWLVGNEQKKIKHIKSRYVFAHLEMSGFLMNSKVVLPDNPSLITADQFTTVESVFTGHFHKRQIQKNIVYTGNIFPFNFSDQGESDRGLMLLQWGKDPIFEAWPEQPLYNRPINLAG
jgi:DNA repair exonuclease SbcCD nuclease subunit